ncbi:DUF2768 domain-containing protein [Planococcus lenghuensis]|uniref:NAD(FAD)-dependent dehydrogenase n=1 Tax=Planococcus lenghuensis TaxID=2213202 RepID=A0A1Q2KZL1_9BACL|nr:DUF2768 domain-containing protein [Planococcus lenghuensis]AQQ53635.1 NAD(FAD)-dependent dehydrogenase [Planococcus lenghuensis]
MTSLDKMWIAFIGMGFLMLSMGLIYLSRYKINNGVLKFVTALTAYGLLIIGCILSAFIVFSGPTGN